MPSPDQCASGRLASRGLAHLYNRSARLRGTRATCRRLFSRLRGSQRRAVLTDYDHRMPGALPAAQHLKAGPHLPSRPLLKYLIQVASSEVTDGPKVPFYSPRLGVTIIDVLLMIFVLFAVFVLGTKATHAWLVGAVLAAAAYAVMWLVSINLTPFRRCPTCSGTGRQSGMMFTWAHRQCPGCGGTGRHRRRNVTAIYGNNLTRGETRAATARRRRNRPRG